MGHFLICSRKSFIMYCRLLNVMIYRKQSINIDEISSWELGGQVHVGCQVLCVNITEKLSLHIRQHENGPHIGIPYVYWKDKEK